MTLDSPYKQHLSCCFGAVFHTILEMYINEKAMQKIGSPAFMFCPGANSVWGTLNFHTQSLSYMTGRLSDKSWFCIIFSPNRSQNITCKEYMLAFDPL